MGSTRAKRAVDDDDDIITFFAQWHAVVELAAVILTLWAAIRISEDAADDSFPFALAAWISPCVLLLGLLMATQKYGIELFAVETIGIAMAQIAGLTVAPLTLWADQCE